jgi:hypothetical protein
MVIDLVRSSGIVLPTWAFPCAVIGLTVVLLPARLRSERASRARRLLTRAAASNSVTERDRLEAEALQEVGADTHGLLTIAGWAVERGRYALARSVLARPELAQHPERRKLLAAMHTAAPLSADALLARVLRESGAEAPNHAGEQRDEQR